MADPILTVVIPHLNFPGLERCVRTLKKMTPIEYRVILVDQSPVDHNWMIQEGLVHLIVKSYRNLGFAKAVNTGLRLADTEYIMALNDDVEFIYDKWWSDIMDEFKALPKAACVNPHSFQNPKGDGSVISQWEYKDVLADGVYSDEEIASMKKLFGNARYNGICMFAPVFKRSALIAVGEREKSPYGLALLDESYGQGSGEDYDMCRRIGLTGMDAMGSARAMVFHRWGSTKNNMPTDQNNPISNFMLIKKGYETMKNKWGPARDGSLPHQHPDGWDVAGRSGPKEPLNGRPWQQIDPL